MKKKVSETEFKSMMAHYGLWARKFRDVWACQYCHMLQYKSDAMPDYMIVREGQSYLVEVKQSNTYWNFSDTEGSGIRDIQRRTMDEWEEEHNPCWLFLVLGAGRVPRGRSAWLIPWNTWKDIQNKLGAYNQRTLGRETKRNVGALELLSEWNVVWSKTYRGWTIPENHIFWDTTGGFIKNDRPVKKGDAIQPVLIT